MTISKFSGCTRSLILLTVVWGITWVAVNVYGQTIYEVQYTTVPNGGTYPSPYMGMVVTLTGVVMAITENTSYDNFFIQDSSGWYSGDSSGVWSGIYVVDNVVHPSRGDYITITGIIDEFWGMTEIALGMFEIVGTMPEFDPHVVTCANIPPHSDSVGERYEGMLVKLENVVVVEAPNQYGEWYVSDNGGIDSTQIDDNCFALDPSPHVGDTFEYIIGAVMFSYFEFEVNPRGPEDFGGVAEEQAPPEQVASLSLARNYPNPFATGTVIEYSMGGRESERVLVQVYDPAGRLVRTLLDGSKEPGVHVIHWDGRDDASGLVPSGVYFCRLEQNGRSKTVRMEVLR
jgi:hypothetical protein